MADMTLTNRILWTTSTDTVWADRIQPHFIQWEGADTSGDNLVIEDTAGNVVWSDTWHANDGGSKVSPCFPPGFIIEGVKVEDIDSGTVRIYLR